MKIQPNSAIKTANIIIDFFSNIDRIDDYFRLRKIERVKDLPVPIPGFGLEDDMVQNYDMYPEDMDIEEATKNNWPKKIDVGLIPKSLTSSNLIVSLSLYIL